MNRRQFLRSTAHVSATAALLPHAAFSAPAGEANPYQRLDHLYLTDFEAEQDESPIVLGNGRQQWLTTLRRKDFPADQEIISWFTREGGAWKEMPPVTPEAGRYEAIAAACADQGEPIVAWTEIADGRWLIKAATTENQRFRPATTVSDPAQRSIHPVVKAIGARSYLLAWEVFSQGQFSLWLARSDDGRWTPPVRVGSKAESCFEPALEVAPTGEIYLAYSCTHGVHRDIHFAVLDPQSLRTIKTVPVAVGGGLKDRVNINARPSLAIDRAGRLWISWENNRFTSRLEDGDNYTGDRCCAMVCYEKGRVYEQKENGRWLFHGKNDHLPTFCKNPAGDLFVLTHCGGGFGPSPHWSFRISHLDPVRGWVAPAALVQTKQKGESLRPSIAFADEGRTFWFAWKSDQTRSLCSCCSGPHVAEAATPDMIHSRRGQLELEHFSAPHFSEPAQPLNLVETVVTEHLPADNFRPVFSGRKRQPRPTRAYRGETYTLLRGNLHEHSENSNCWPAGTDGTLDDDFRFGLYSEGYDFAGITDHGYSLTETYWRKSLRMAEFYNDPHHFVALPSLEWTLSNHNKPEIGRGVGHRNLFFADVNEARKFIRNKDEVFSETNPECADAEKLWALIRRVGIDCVSIPHHPADETHPCCWETRDEEIEPVVEIFQCRGNAEYRGAPRMLNVSRHKPLANDRGFVDYALREKGYHLGFVASGDHNSMGVGLACLWVKEVSRRGILEALRARRCFATTGDQIVVDYRVNGAWAGATVPRGAAPTMTFSIEGSDDITCVEILRNSRVVHHYEPAAATHAVTGEWTDPGHATEPGVLYYYLRVTQKNHHLAWSSPVWLEGSAGERRALPMLGTG